MRVSGLIDSGAILALLDSDDAWHTRCVETFRTAALPLGTSVAVLTELFHLVGDNPHHVSAAWKFVRSGAVTVLPIGDGDLPALESLMARYGDHPMDLADATLVRLARRENVNLVFTVDNSDFETYRIDGRRRFRVIPGRGGVVGRPSRR